MYIYKKGTVTFQMKRFASLLLALFLVIPLTSCGNGGEKYLDQVIYGMDTYITLRVADKTHDGGKVSDAYFDEICEKSAYIIAKNEKLMSAHNEDAQIYGLNNGVNMILSPDDSLLSVLRAADNISEKTGGAFSYTLGGLSKLWNVKEGGPVPSDEDIAEALLHISKGSVEFSEDKITKSDKECLIDLGGVAKGYTAQEIVEYLSTTNIPYGLVSMGGNIGVFGSKEDGTPFKVGVTDPSDTSKVVGYLKIGSGFISVSGSYERFFEENGVRYHHIIDPETGRPADSGILSVAVWTNNGSVSDALSTALFVMGVEGATEFYKSGQIDFEAVIITEDREIVLTDGIADGNFELSSENYTVRKMN